MKRLPIALLLALAAALALAACGGGGSSTTSGEAEGAIEKAIRMAATTTDPSKCAKAQTQEFNEAETSTSGDQARTVCEEEAKEDKAPAESVRISHIQVDGDTATAAAAVKGGSLDRQSVELELVEEEGAWKLNKFLGFTKYDGKALAESLEGRLSGQEGINGALAKCIAEGIAELPQDEAEKLAFEKSLEPIEELLKGCQ